jgi:hypothetical protein
MAMTRDEDARLALATELRQAILSGSLVMARFAARGQADEAGNSAALMAKAVSHAVLTSGLRAPADAQAATFTASAGPIPPEATQVEASGTGRLKVTAETAASMLADPPLRPAEASAVATSDCLTCGYPCSIADHAAVTRQGWRARLANVERLLAEFWEGGHSPGDLRGEDWAKVQQALAEVRGMLGGE